MSVDYNYISEADNPFITNGVHNMCVICLKTVNLDTRMCMTTKLPLPHTEEPVEAYQVLQSISKFVCTKETPKSLCSHCFDQTISVHKFQTACNRAQLRLEHYKRCKLQETNGGDGHADVKIETVEIIEEINNSAVKIESNSINVAVGFDRCEEVCIKGEIEELQDSNDGHEVEIGETNITLPNYPVNEINGKESDGVVNYCSLCKICFESHGELVKHMSAHDENWSNDQENVNLFDEEANSSDPDYVCDTERTKERTKRLGRPRTATRCHPCSVCDKIFKRAGALRIHLRTHTGERLFECKICDKTFQQNRHLKDHLRTHTGEKPFKCQFCDKAYVHSKSLTEHERVHTGERPFKCSFCAKGFSRKYSLASHSRMHTGDLPYTCVQCGKSFSLKNTLRIHVNRSNCGKNHLRTTVIDD